MSAHLRRARTHMKANQKNFIAEMRCHGLTEEKIMEQARQRYVRHGHDEPPGRCVNGRWRVR